VAQGDYSEVMAFWEVVANQRLDTLTPRKQKDVARDLIDEVELRDIEDTLEHKGQIRVGLNDFVDILPPSDAIDFMLDLKFIDSDEDGSRVGRYKSGSSLNRTKMYISKPSDTANPIRSTVQHEAMHHYLKSNGKEKDNQTEFKKERWQKASIYNSKLRDTGISPYDPWTYQDMGESLWGNNINNKFPHPTTYMLGPREDIDGNPRAEELGFDEWHRPLMEQVAHISKQVDLENTSWTELGENESLDVDSLGLGAAIEVNDPEAAGTVAGVYTRGPYRKPDLPAEYRVVELSLPQETIELTVESDGSLTPHSRQLVASYAESDQREMRQTYPPEPAEDPGFTGKTDPLTEGLNRALWRQMVAAEAQPGDLRSSYALGRTYSATNSHETSALAAELMFSVRNASSERRVDPDEIGDVAQRHPDLIWALANRFSLPDDFRDEVVDGVDEDTWAEFLKRADPT
jgi:hypothetical protein